MGVEQVVGSCVLTRSYLFQFISGNERSRSVAPTAGILIASRVRKNVAHVLVKLKTSLSALRIRNSKGFSVGKPLNNPVLRGRAMLPRPYGYIRGM